MLQKRVRELVLEVAQELGIEPKQAVQAYRRYWLWVKDTVEEMPLASTSEEDFPNIRSSINIPNLGKIHASYNRVQRINKSKQIINERTNNKKGETLT